MHLINQLSDLSEICLLMSSGTMLSRMSVQLKPGQLISIQRSPSVVVQHCSLNAPHHVSAHFFPLKCHYFYFLFLFHRLCLSLRFDCLLIFALISLIPLIAIESLSLMYCILWPNNWIAIPFVFHLCASHSDSSQLRSANPNPRNRSAAECRPTQSLSLSMASRPVQCLQCMSRPTV